MSRLYRVSSPERNYTGTVAGVVFASGEAIVDERNRAALSYFGRRGYTVANLDVSEPSDDETVDDETVDDETEEDQDGQVPRPPASASKAKWVAYAVSRGFDPDEAKESTRDELIEATRDEETGQ